MHSTKAITFVDIIKDYQETANLAVHTFKNKYNVDDIIEGWHKRAYERIGKLPEEGIMQYYFHGIGLEAHFKNKIIDFDFAYFPNPRHDGFDIWRLSCFIENQRKKYPKFNNKARIKDEFNKLINQGLIARPKLKNSTTLYFFKNTLEGIEIEQEEKQTKYNFFRKLWLAISSK